MRSVELVVGFAAASELSLVAEYDSCIALCSQTESDRKHNTDGCFIRQGVSQRTKVEFVYRMFGMRRGW